MNVEPLAKGAPDWTSLKVHSAGVLCCADAMLKAFAPYIDADTTKDIRRAAIYHDLGKVASGFQNSLQSGRRWGYRHEVLTAAILLSIGIEEQFPLVIPAVLTHHKSLNGDHSMLSDCTGVNVSDENLCYYFKEWRARTSELAGFWGWIKEYIRRSDPVFGEELAARLPESAENLPNLRDYCRKLMNRVGGSSYGGLAQASLRCIIARGLLMAADHLASSGIGEPLVELDPNPMRLRKFQRLLGKHQGSAILEAPTGSGKTRAAIAWALANRRAGERIFYVLPYQASINAMSRTLAGDKGFGFGKDAVGVIHHNALIQEFRCHYDDEADNYEEAKDAARHRVDQTRQFFRPIKVITPHQIIKLLFGCKRFEIGISEMLGGLVIFDEIHSYDPHVAALIDVAVSRLKVLGIRCLFMTATFPQFMKQRLVANIPDLADFGITGQDSWEKNLLSRARHKLVLHDCALEDLVLDIVNAAKRGTVLVVCNRVQQAKAVFDIIRTRVKSVELLHGGFTARDRYKKEQRLFKRPGSQRPAYRVLVATQVIEVSLNISFNTIYTEIAPVDDLLQRFGRVNRVYELRRPTDVHIALQFDEQRLRHIYDLERLQLTREFAPDGRELTCRVENDWVRNVYSGGYLPKEQEIYDRVRESFERVVDNLRPLHDGDDTEFFELFNSVQVLPVELLDEYLRAQTDKRYIQCAEMLMSMPVSTFMGLDRDGAIDKVTIPCDRESYILVVKRHYDPEIGLTDDPVGMPVAIIE